MKQPLVSILLAIHKPNPEFLKEQLQSIANQTYQSLNLYVVEDSGNPLFFKESKLILESTKFRFPIHIKANNVNLGSNKTFEQLTEWADGEFFAYCDQDDIWEINKIELLVQKILDTNAMLAYSDLSIIDEFGKLNHRSILKANPSLRHIQGTHCFLPLLLRNSITGCSMLVKSTVAKIALPFNNYYIHDHWLALVSSSQGLIVYHQQPLVRYRVHSKNQIGTKILPKIDSKDEYFNLIIQKNYERIIQSNEVELFKDKKKELRMIQQFFEIRMRLFKHQGMTLKALIQGLFVDSKIMGFEILLNILPNKIANALLRLLN